MQPAVAEPLPRLDHPGCLSFARQSLQECIEEHDKQRRLSPPQLPSRIIEVASRDNIRLIEVVHFRSPYLTLSHRWGDTAETTPTKTTSATLAQHQRGIARETLTPVLRDAIDVTLGLGMTFIWIDSLCIIQDDPEDWGRESGNMSAIYGNSTLTIFAAVPSVLFPTPQVTRKHIVHLNVGGSCPIVVKARYLSMQPHPGESLMPVPWGSLFGRGWVFQEWHLSRRALIFGENELLWYCDHGTRCECNPRLAENGYLATSPECRMHKTKKDYWMTLQHEHTAPDNGALWLHIAEEYSKTHMTYEGDRLPAISGLAKRFRKDYSTEYVAGCWKDDIVSSLLWFTLPRTSSNRPRPPSALGVHPTWSWTSSCSHVGFVRVDRSNPGFRREFVVVEHVDSVMATEDVTGAVKSAHLTIVGPVVDCSYRLESGSCHIGSLRWQDVYYDNDLWLHQSFGASDARRLQGLCVLVSGTFVKCCKKAVLQEYALILTPSTTSPGCYEREGLYSTRHNQSHDVVCTSSDHTLIDLGDHDLQQQPTWARFLNSDEIDAKQNAQRNIFLEELGKRGIDLSVFDKIIYRQSTLRRLTIV